MEDTMYGIRFLLFVYILPIIAIIVTIAVIRKIKEKREEKREEKRIEISKMEQAQRREAEMQRIQILLEKYMNNPVAIRTAEEFVKVFKKTIKSARRDIKTKNVYCCEEFGAIIKEDEGLFCTCVGIVSSEMEWDIMSKKLTPLFVYHYHRGDLINFKNENLRPLQNHEEMYAFVRAVAKHAYDMIKECYEKDESGTKVQITTQERSGYSYCGEYGISVKFEYSAENGFYTAPAEW